MLFSGPSSTRLAEARDKFDQIGAKGIARQLSTWERRFVIYWKANQTWHGDSCKDMRSEALLLEW